MADESFKQTRSIANRIRVTTFVIAFFLLLEVVGLYFVSWTSFENLSKLHEITLTADVSRQAREILYSIGESLQPKGLKGAEIIESRRVVLQAAERDLALIREAQEDIRFDEMTERALRDAEASVVQLIATLKRMSERPAEDESLVLVADQYVLEALESMRKVQIRLTERSDLVFRQVRATRDFPVIASGILALILFSVALGVGWSAARRLKRSLGSLVHTADEIASGNMNARAKIYEPDEIGYLADAFNKMTASLEARTVSLDYVVAIIESMHDAVIVFDDEGRIRRVNDVSSQLFGYRVDEFGGRPIVELFDGWTPGRKRDQNVETEAVDRDGKRIPVEVSTTSISGGRSGRFHYVCVVKDITDRKRAEREIAKRSVELEAANKELEAFSYSVSHDLRAPLRAIDGFSHALLEENGDKLDEQGKKDLGRVRAASQTMGRLIDDILNLSRLSRSEMTKVDVDISEIATSIAQNLRDTDPSRKVEFVIEPGLHADADPALLRIALDNLIGNAWKYTSKHDSARIEIGVSKKTDGKQTFFVKDDGAGFDPTYASRLFGAFQRLHSPKEFPGTGIGLATVQRIVRRHGGSIWAEGEVEKGSTFYFTL